MTKKTVKTKRKSREWEDAKFALDHAVVRNAPEEEILQLEKELKELDQ